LQYYTTSASAANQKYISSHKHHWR